MKKRKCYSDDDLARAVDAHECGASWGTIREAFPTVPERTIRRRAAHRRDGVTLQKTGPPPVLPCEIEDDLHAWIVGMQREGFHVAREMLLSKANETYHVLYNPARSAGFPDEGWIKRFFARHPQLSLRTPQVISRTKNQVKQEGLDLLLNQLIKHAVERKLTSDRVFNMDETGFGQKSK